MVRPIILCSQLCCGLQGAAMCRHPENVPWGGISYRRSSPQCYVVPSWLSGTGWISFDGVLHAAERIPASSAVRTKRMQLKWGSGRDESFSLPLWKCAFPLRLDAGGLHDRLGARPDCHVATGRRTSQHMAASTCRSVARGTVSRTGNSVLAERIVQKRR
jgi:hypothetical protein